MDFLSNKIILFYFQFHTNYTHIDRTLLSERNYKLLTELEGQLDIYLDGNKFFSEDGVLLLELGIELTTWSNKLLQGSFSNFNYETMSYSEGPIIEFHKDDGNESWSIHSIWQEFNYSKNISTDTLINSINSFLNNLRNVLKEKYKINIEWFI